MVEPIETAWVKLWGERIGAVSWSSTEGGFFQFTQEFIAKGLDVSPLMMPIQKAQPSGVYAMPHLSMDVFHRLPGLLADSLPDKFGNSLIENWLTEQGRNPESMSPVERLCYTGTRGMGALEYEPTLQLGVQKTTPLQLEAMVKLMQQVYDERGTLSTNIEDQDALLSIYRVGTSAGGARPKAVVAINDEGHVISGQADVPTGYSHWLLKFDGVKDAELGQSDGKGRVEYAYYLMAQQASIDMNTSRLLIENNRAHFITKRFDRIGNDKVHMQTLCSLAHMDMNLPHSYERAFEVLRRLELTAKEQAQFYRRMVFNVLSRNHDDHTKNHAFLMDKQGQWSLSPCYDVTFNYKEGGRWTGSHQMSVAGKRDHFKLPYDLLDVGKAMGIRHAGEIYDQVNHVVTNWLNFADQAGVDMKTADKIQSYLRATPSSKQGLRF